MSLISEERLWSQLGDFLPIVVVLPCGDVLIAKGFTPVIAELIEEN